MYFVVYIIAWKEYIWRRSVSKSINTLEDSFAYAVYLGRDEAVVTK
jgi:hypothetical protein